MLKNSRNKVFIILIYFLFTHYVLAEKATLTVYTYNSFTSEWGPGLQIKKNFEAKCDCKLKFVSLGDGVALLNRLRMEGEKSKADVVLGLDNNLIDSAKSSGLFVSADINTEVINLPIEWKDVTFIPYDYGYFAFIYDTNKIKEPPKSMDELLNSSEPWKIIYQDPRISSLGLGLILWVEKLYADKASDAWHKIARKTLTVTKNWSESYALLLKGEGDFVLSYTSSPGHQIFNYQKNNYAAALFHEGHYMHIEVAARLKNSLQPELAKQFLKFMLTPEFQSVLPVRNWMYPILNIPLPEVYNSLSLPKKSLQFSSTEVTKERKNWIRLWQNVVSR
ncbi:Thiamine-binding periplasmic protein [Candidatus Hartigia pinicola]|nr:Thiamine-binding periplasmic protein [Candidatus Hartigia pinicola]